MPAKPSTLSSVSSSATSTGVPRGCTNLKLRQLTRLVGRYYDGHVANAGVKTTQYSLLSHIAALGPMRPSELAAAMTLEASTLTRNLQPLVAQGWVQVGPGVDGRSRMVQITEAGLAKRTEAKRAWKLAQLALNQQLGDERVMRLHALLDECMGLLEADEPADAAGPASG